MSNEPQKNPRGRKRLTAAVLLGGGLLVGVLRPDLLPDVLKLFASSL